MQSSKAPEQPLAIITSSAWVTRQWGNWRKENACNLWEGGWGRRQTLPLPLELPATRSWGGGGHETFLHAIPSSQSFLLTCGRIHYLVLLMRVEGLLRWPPGLQRKRFQFSYASVIKGKYQSACSHMSWDLRYRAKSTFWKDLQGNIKIKQERRNHVKTFRRSPVVNNLSNRIRSSIRLVRGYKAEWEERNGKGEREDVRPGIFEGHSRWIAAISNVARGSGRRKVQEKKTPSPFYGTKTALPFIFILFYFCHVLLLIRRLLQNILWYEEKYF